MTLAKLVVGGVLVVLCSRALSQVQYSVTEIGTLGGRNVFPADINNLGKVVGWSEIEPESPYPTHPFLYSTGTMTDLFTIGHLGVDDGQAHAINDNNEIVGAVRTVVGMGEPHRAVRWDQSGILNLGILPGADFSFAWDIANDGTAVGMSAQYLENGTC